MSRKSKTPEPVFFDVEAKPDAQADDIKQILENLSDRLVIEVLIFRNFGITLIVGMTDQKTYERVFNAKLQYRTRTIPNLNKAPYQVQEWVEVKPAEVPVTLKGKVKAILLAESEYLTD